MARRVPLAALALAVLAGAAAAADPPRGVLAGYSFDDDGPAAGPDTFAVFAGGQGGVRLSSTFHLSGYRAVEIRDVVGDAEFPELQGYFAPQAAGRLYFHFAFLTTDPKDEMNVALAGPRFFQVEKDGIAFWLGTRAGTLVHHSDSIHKRLFAVEAFVWYAVDVAYDVERGVYDLRIRREGEKAPLVALRDAPNAAKAPGSAVDKFSFVGAPFGDSSNVTYYVDDVVIGTDESVAELPFVAPGRRKLFVDAFAEHQRRLLERPRCLPALDPADLGLTRDDAAELRRAGLLGTLEALLRGEAPPPGVPRGRWAAALQSVEVWREGCAALDRGELLIALARFERAEAGRPGARLYGLSQAVALAGLRRFEEADDELARLAEAWGDDPRYAVAAAFAAWRRGDLERAEAALREAALRQPGPDARAAEQYYFVQLWLERYGAARDFALALAARGLDAPSGTSWLERAGDAAFHAGAVAEARGLYERARRRQSYRAMLDLKLADVAFREGDLEQERLLRERYYGALRED